MWLLESGGQVSVSEHRVVTRLGIDTAVDHLYADLSWKTSDTALFIGRPGIMHNDSYRFSLTPSGTLCDQVDHRRVMCLQQISLKTCHQLTSGVVLAGNSRL